MEKVIDKLYTGIDEFLVNDHHLDVASKILLGSWIETQYLALNHLCSSSNKNMMGILNKIWEQKLHLNNINLLLTEYSDHEQLKEIAKDLEAFYKDFYEKAFSVESFNNKETLNKMLQTISKIRNKVINP